MLKVRRALNKIAAPHFCFRRSRNLITTLIVVSFVGFYTLWNDDKYKQNSNRLPVYMEKTLLSRREFHFQHAATTKPIKNQATYKLLTIPTVNKNNRSIQQHDDVKADVTSSAEPSSENIEWNSADIENRIKKLFEATKFPQDQVEEKHVEKSTAKQSVTLANETTNRPVTFKRDMTEQTIAVKPTTKASTTNKQTTLQLTTKLKTMKITVKPKTKLTTKLAVIKDDNPKPQAKTVPQVLPVPPSYNMTDESVCVISSFNKTSPDIKDKLILMYTPLTKSKPLWSIRTWKLHHCPHNYTNCNFCNDRRVLMYSDVVLFRLRMLKAAPDQLREFLQKYDEKEIPTVKPLNQLWVDVNQESPLYSHSDEELYPFDDKMDLFISYLSKADYQYKYTRLVIKRSKKTTPIDYSQNKTKTALWFVSHCGALSKRDQYIKKLMQYNITVDIFGACSGKQDGCQKHDHNCIMNLRKKYHFYIAFENSICDEYITEKFWNTLEQDSYNIPIALGASVKDYTITAPPNSFLHVDNFTSPYHLATYMNQIMSDKSLFNGYHKWREEFYTEVPVEETFPCWVCRMANQKPKSERKEKFSEHWSRKQCRDPKTINY